MCGICSYMIILIKYKTYISVRYIGVKMLWVTLYIHTFPYILQLSIITLLIFIIRFVIKMH